MINNKYLLFALIFFLITLFQCSRVEEQAAYIYHAQHVKSNLEINGILDEEAWKHSKKAALKINATADSVTDSTMLTWVKSCYDDNNLYIAFEFSDSDIWSEFTQRDDHLWENDAIEIFIDTDGNLSTYYEIQVSPRNVLFDAHLEIPDKTNDDEIIAFNIKGIQTAVTVDGSLNIRDDIDKKWTVEIAIPVSDLTEEKARFDSGSWRINFFRMNQDIEGEKPEQGWSPTLGDFHMPSKFGVLKFN
jgi:hypothetical protein